MEGKVCDFSEWSWIFDPFPRWRNESFISSGTFPNNQVITSQGHTLITLFLDLFFIPLRLATKCRHTRNTIQLILIDYTIPPTPPTLLCLLQFLRHIKLIVFRITWLRYLVTNEASRCRYTGYTILVSKTPRLRFYHVFFCSCCCAMGSTGWVSNASS